MFLIRMPVVTKKMMNLKDEIVAPELMKNLTN